MYSSIEFYEESFGGILDDEDLIEKQLKKASRIIDVLTYNRINEDYLSGYEKDVLNEVCCEIADFLYSNEDVINTVISGYSINGVNVNYNLQNKGLVEINGIIINKTTYSKLKTLRYCDKFFY